MACFTLDRIANDAGLSGFLPNSRVMAVRRAESDDSPKDAAPSVGRLRGRPVMVRKIESKPLRENRNIDAMPNIHTLLKQEITRIARKEVRRATDDVKKSSSSHRSQISALRREVADLRRALKAAMRAAPNASEPAAEARSGVQRRFRVSGFASMRKRLGLSAQQLGTLIGVTGQTVYKWEKGEAKPRAAQLAAIAAVRPLTARQAREKLQELDRQASAGSASSAGSQERRPRKSRAPAAAKRSARRAAAKRRSGAPGKALAVQERAG